MMRSRNGSERIGGHSPFLPLAVAATLLPSALGSVPGAQANGGLELVDRVVAVVDEDPILLSDVERALALEARPPQEGESRAARERQALDGLIEQMLRQHEIARFGYEDAPLGEVDRQLTAVRSRFPDDAAWRAELARLGLDENQVRSLLAHQLSVLRFVEERLGPRVFVSVDDIRAHYDQRLVPELRAKGEPVPPIEQVRESIRAVLKQERLNAEIDRWTAELRANADVVDLLESEERPLPPPVAEIGADEP